MKQSLQRSKMKIIPAISLLSLCITILLAGLATAEMVDKVVAVVNEDIITLSELEEETTDIYRTLSQNTSPEDLLETMDEARERALDKMIDRILMEQKAKQFNLSVSKEEVNTAYERMRTKMSATPKQFREKLEQSGITEEKYKSKLRDNILQSKIVSVDVRSKIVVTDEMILNYYDQHYTSRVSKGDYYLLQIGFTWGDKSGASIDEKQAHALKLAERIHTLAGNGQDFQTLAKKFSDLPSSVDGGDIGVFTLDEMAEAMREAVKDLEPGEVSQVIKLGSAYQFFKLLSGEDEAIVVTSSFEASKEEIREKLYEIKMQEAYRTWAKELKQSAYIQKL